MTTDDLTPDVQTPPSKVKLRKEALIFEQPRHAVGLLAAACTLVGVIVGFSMGLLSSRTTSHHCHSDTTHHISSTTVAPTPVVVAGEAVEAGPSFLGVQIRTDNELVADVGTSGARVIEVIPNTPAARVGIHKGDLIVRVDEVRVSDMHQLMSTIRARAPSTPVVVGFYRDGDYRTVTTPLMKLPKQLR